MVLDGKRLFCRRDSRGFRIGMLLCRGIRGLGGIIRCRRGGLGSRVSGVLGRGLRGRGRLSAVSGGGCGIRFFGAFLGIFGCRVLGCAECSDGLNQLILREISH